MLFSLRGSIIAIPILALSSLSYSQSYDSLKNDPAGTQIKEVDYSTDFIGGSFSYSKGWAGQGFGLSGTQRGAPEYIVSQIVPNTEQHALVFASKNRNEAWYALHPEAAESNLYAVTDSDGQDDFFFYGKPWVKEDNPYFYGQLYLGEASRVTSFRLTVKRLNNNQLKDHYPGLWIYQDRLHVRIPKGSPFDVRFLNSYQPLSGWITAGIHISDTGEVTYYLKKGMYDEYTLFTLPDFRITASDAAKLLGFERYSPRVVERNDAAIMLSQVISKTHLNDFSDGKFNAIKALKQGINFELGCGNCEKINNLTEATTWAQVNSFSPEQYDISSYESVNLEVSVDGRVYSNALYYYENENWKHDLCSLLDGENDPLDILRCGTIIDNGEVVTLLGQEYNYLFSDRPGVVVSVSFNRPIEPENNSESVTPNDEQPDTTGEINESSDTDNSETTTSSPNNESSSNPLSSYFMMLLTWLINLINSLFSR